MPWTITSTHSTHMHARVECEHVPNISRLAERTQTNPMNMRNDKQVIGGDRGQLLLTVTANNDTWIVQPHVCVCVCTFSSIYDIPVDSRRRKWQKCHLNSLNFSSSVKMNGFYSCRLPLIRSKWHKGTRHCVQRKKKKMFFTTACYRTRKIVPNGEMTIGGRRLSLFFYLSLISKFDDGVGVSECGYANGM